MPRGATMTDVDKDTFAINDGYYDWSIRTYEAIRKRLGLNLKVHPDDERLKAGHIFLFNHFARFETVIPPATNHNHTSTTDKGEALTVKPHVESVET